MMSRAALERQITRVTKRAARMNERDKARWAELLRVFETGACFDAHQEKVLRELAEAVGAAKGPRDAG